MVAAALAAVGLEEVSGNPIGRAAVWARIQEVRASTGMTVLVTTHYMDEADQHCDRIAMMHHGWIHGLGTPAELKKGLGPDATLDDVFLASTGAGLGAVASDGSRDGTPPQGHQHRSGPRPGRLPAHCRPCPGAAPVRASCLEDRHDVRSRTAKDAA